MAKPTLTPINIITGKVAIRFAEKNGLSLNKHATLLDKEKKNLTPDQAKEVAKTNPELIWLDIKNETI